MESLWQKTAQRTHFTPLTEDKSTDVLIVGGGITGILCARFLKKAGADFLLLEADRICGGVTQNTTAKITLAHGLLYDKLLHRFGEEKARLYREAQSDAAEHYARLCEQIDCDYEKKDSYVYSPCDRKKIEREVAAERRLGIDAVLSDAPALPFPVAGAVRVKNQAQLHPLKLAFALAQDLPIYEGTKVTELLPHTARTSHATVRFKRLLIATHFPILNKHGLYFLKLYQHRSYVLALRGAGKVEGMYADESDKGLSFRQYGEYLLISGGGHRTGKRGEGWRAAERVAKAHYPNAEIAARWATQDCMTLDGIPYIGKYASETPDVYVATGFNKWGMTNAMVSADILCDLLCGKSNRYAALFSPSRSINAPPPRFIAFLVKIVA